MKKEYEYDDYICDDREDISAWCEKIKNMTDEEFEVYCQGLRMKKQSVEEIGGE